MLRTHLSRALAGAVALLPAPVVAGDLPDPSAIFDHGRHVAVVTANGWAPSMRILTSTDLSHWELRGAVFNRPPRWAITNFWAPELFRRSDGRYSVFYSARSRRRGDRWYCIGVATAPAATGPYRDLGRPLRCGRYGSIDPYPTRDGSGRLYLLFKEDGNEFGRRTRILAQELSEDARRVFGPSKELLVNDSSWEGKVVEAPGVVRVGDYFYMTYAGGLFGGTKGCDYAVGVARSTSLLGPYEKSPANPILRGGNGWSCPGHATVYPTPDGGLNALYAAYRGGNGKVAGRQLLSQPAAVGPDGWLRIGSSNTPPPPSPGAASLAFSDRFRSLDRAWEWPFMYRPGIAAGAGLHLRGARQAGARLDAAVLARQTSTQNYTATAVLDRRALRGPAQGGLASYRSEFEAIGLSVGRSEMTVWQRRFGKFRRLATARAPKANLVHLRMVARGDDFRFQWSPDGIVWRRVGRRAFHGPIEESARMALTAGGVRGARARFNSAAVSER